jgi:hypothetical protein
MHASLLLATLCRLDSLKCRRQIQRLHRSRPPHNRPIHHQQDSVSPRLAIRRSVRQVHPLQGSVNRDLASQASDRPLLLPNRLRRLLVDHPQHLHLAVVPLLLARLQVSAMRSNLGPVQDSIQPNRSRVDLVLVNLHLEPPRQLAGPQRPLLVLRAVLEPDPRLLGNRQSPLHPQTAPRLRLGNQQVWVHVLAHRLGEHHPRALSRA